MHPVRAVYSADLDAAGLAGALNRQRFDHLLHALSRSTHDRELVMIGAQAVHAVTDDPPDDVQMSRECNVLLDDSDTIVAAIDERPGRDSAYAAESYVHVDT